MKLSSVGLCLACVLMFEESTGSFEKPRGYGSHIRFVGIVENSEMEENSKALLQAVLDGDESEVMSFVRKGSNIDFRGDRGITPLIGATEKGYIEIVRYLLLCGAHVNARRMDSAYSSLMIACQNNNLEMVKLLIQFGADVDQRCDSGFTAFDFALNNNNREILMALLISHDELNTSFESIADENTKLLFYATKYGRKNIVRYCVEDLNVDVNSKGENGETPLIIACKKGYDDIVEYLLTNNAKINEKMDGGSTALMFACIGGFQDIVRMLVSCDADVNLVDERANSSLILAVDNSHLEMAKMLIEAGSEIDQKNNLEETPLSIAMSHYELARQSRRGVEKSQWQQIIDLLKKVKSNFNSLLR